MKKKMRNICLFLHFAVMPKIVVGNLFAVVSCRAITIIVLKIII